MSVGHFVPDSYNLTADDPESQLLVGSDLDAGELQGLEEPLLSSTFDQRPAVGV